MIISYRRIRFTVLNKKSSLKFLCGLCLALGVLSTRCGQIGIGLGGGTQASNDVRPTGTQIGAGSFSGLNGKSVSGNAAIFKSLADGSFTLALEGMSVPQETGLSIQVYNSLGNQVQQITLLSTSGNKNYPLTGISGNSTFKAIYIYSSTNQTQYAVANLQ